MTVMKKIVMVSVALAAGLASAQDGLRVCRPDETHSAQLRRHTGIPSLAVSPVNGRLWVTFYGGVTPGEDSNSYVPLMTSADGGRTWKTVCVVEPESGRRVFDPELWVAPDGRLRWSFTSRACKPTARDNLKCYAGDQGDVKTDCLMWGELDAENEPVTLPVFRQVADGVMMCKPTVLRDGTWLLPVAHWKAEPSACFFASMDGGKTFALRGGVSHFPIENREYDEHTVVELGNGDLLTFIRARKDPSCLESVSHDGGRTWEVGKPARFAQTNARHFLRRLRSGNLLLVKSGPIDRNVGRCKLTAFVSDDDGATWKGGLLLDERETTSYPDGDQAADGTIYVTYDRDRLRRQEILLAAFAEDEVLSGKVSHPSSFLQRVIMCKAPGGGACGACVDPMIGTKGMGHTFPGPCRPFGLVQPSPDTGNGSWDYCAGYAYDDRVIRRFSQTHLNGTGQASLGDVGVLPFVGSANDQKSLVGAFRKEDEHVELGYYRVAFTNGVVTEIAAGERVAHYRFTLPDNGSILLDFPYGLYRERGYLPKLTTQCDVTKVSARRLEGHNHSEIWVPRDIYYVVSFGCDPDSLDELPREKDDKGPKYVARFAKGGKVELRIALSAKSLVGARRNMEAESLADFDLRVAETKTAWENILSRLACPSSDAAVRKVFYTALYHLCIQPNDISDFGETPRYSTFSLWDTFRDAHLLYERIVPERVTGFVNSFLDHYDRYGFLPRWELWGRESNCMIANHAVPVIADAYANPAIRARGGVDWEKAYRAVKDSLTREFSGRTKADWAVYDKYGYYPYDLIPHESVSRTLECCFDDFRAAEFARKLGKGDDVAFFERRSWNFTNLFDRATLLFRPRDSKGEFLKDFNPVSARWGGDYTEGSAWQYVWHVLHRPEWLVEAMGGAEAFEKRLDAFFAGSFCADQPRFYNRDITGLIGDYAHGNEPCQHVTALYRFTAHPEKEDAIVTKILGEFYRPEPGGLRGNDDCGQMSAWYLNKLTVGE